MKTYVLELDNRPDGEVNAILNGYSSETIALNQYYTRCAVAVATELFTSVVLEVTRADGQILKRDIIKTAYVPPVPPEPEEPEETNED